MDLTTEMANIVIDRYNLKMDRTMPGSPYAPFIKALIHKLEDMQDLIYMQDSIINNSDEVKKVCRTY